MRPSNEAPAAEPRRLGSYTTAKVSAGRIERLEQHVARLRRDAGRLGLPLPAGRDVERVSLESARETFGRGDGIVRVEWSHLPAIPRAFNPTGDAWRTIVSKATHPGREFRANTKYTDVPAYDLGREEVASSEIDEVLLFDADGFLVEGSHSNFLAVTAEGRLVTPAYALGGVEGLGLTIVRHGRDVAEAWLASEDVENARELMSVNTVRGVVPIIEVGDHRVADGRPGPLSRTLAAIFQTR